MYATFGLLIDGQWRQAADGATVDIFSPVTEERIGAVPAA
jgi:succinate-semialdehyde dehydrogenase/glutarate-semialdehyde dehydrogenase